MRHQQTYSGDRVLEQETRTKKALEKKFDKQIMQMNCLIQHNSALALIIFHFSSYLENSRTFFFSYNMVCCAYLQFIAMLNRAEMVQHIIQNFDAELQITQTHLIFSEHPLALLPANCIISSGWCSLNKLFFFFELQ